MTTKDLNQRVFEAMGWFKDEEGWWWSHNKKDGGYFLELPNATESWEVCRKYVIPFMRGKGFSYGVTAYPDKLGLAFIWQGQSELDNWQSADAEIINDNLPPALVEATLKVLEGE